MEINYEILNKYSSGLCSEEEKKEVYRAVQNDFSLCFIIIQKMQEQAMVEIGEMPGADLMRFDLPAETSEMIESTPDVAKYAPITTVIRFCYCRSEDNLMSHITKMEKRSFSKEDFVEFFKRVIRYIKSRE